MKSCTIPDINKKVVKVYKDWYNLFYKIMLIFIFILGIIECVKFGHIGFSIASLIYASIVVYLFSIPYILQRKEIMQIETFYVVKIKYHSVVTRNTVTYYFDYFGKERNVYAVGGIGYAYNLPKNGSDLIVGMYKTKSGKEKFCCALPRQVE